jgi:hypothetical protein
MTSHVSAEQSANSLPLTWQRLLALSGVAFAVLILVGWFASGGDAPDYGASDQDWTSWASDNQWKSRIGAFAMLLAGFVFLHFAATIRTALGDAEARAGGSVQLARVASHAGQASRRSSARLGFSSRSLRFSRAWARTVCSASASSLAYWRWRCGRSLRVSLDTGLWERRQARHPTGQRRDDL